MQLVKLAGYAVTDHTTKVVQQMKVIVPEFKSKNSIFEELDVERQEAPGIPQN